MAILTACGGGGSGGLTGPPGGGNPAAVDTLVLSLDSAEVIIGDTLRLIAVATDAQGVPVPGIVFVWTSSNPAVATVSDGLVSAVGEGEAEIAVDVAGASQLQASLQASTSRGPIALAASQPPRGKSRAKVIVVKQSACEGALGVKTWDAILELSYRATGSHLEERYTVSQGSSATAHLTLTPGYDPKRADWIGEVKGTARIDNVLTHPDNLAPGGLYKLTEKTDGPLENIGATAAHLTIRDDGGNCHFTLTYVERMTWTATRTYLGSQNMTGSIGAASVFLDLGKKPSGGWVLAGTRTLPAQKEILDPELPSLPGSGVYLPASAVAAVLVEASPGTKGSATFAFGLTAK